MKVTEHFTMSEFMCKDGTDVPSRYQGNVAALCLSLEYLRGLLASPVIIISGYRTKEYNTKCGGAVKSQHLTASAADIRVPGYTPDDVSQALEGLISSGKIPQGGIGVYPSQNFVHYDVRLERARWDG